MKTKRITAEDKFVRLVKRREKIARMVADLYVEALELEPEIDKAWSKMSPKQRRPWILDGWG